MNSDCNLGIILHYMKLLCFKDLNFGGRKSRIDKMGENGFQCLGEFTDGIYFVVYKSSKCTNIGIMYVF